MGEKEETLGGKISFFQILPRLMKFRLLRKKNGVSFTVVHCDRPRQDTSSDVSLFSAFTTGNIPLIFCHPILPTLFRKSFQFENVCFAHTLTTQRDYTFGLGSFLFT